MIRQVTKKNVRRDSLPKKRHVEILSGPDGITGDSWSYDAKYHGRNIHDVYVNIGYQDRSRDVAGEKISITVQVRLPRG